MSMDGGNLFRCARGHLSRWRMHRPHGRFPEHYGHQSIGTLADYLGVGTGVLKVGNHAHWRDSNELLVLSWERA